MAALVAASGFVSLVAPAPAGACSMAGPVADFDGTVVGIAGDVVTYRVIRDRPTFDRTPGQVPLPPDRVPEPGGTVVVRYDGTKRPLQVGHRYRVVGFPRGQKGISSQIAFDFKGDCGTGAGTTALDGSYLGATPGNLGPPWPYLFAGGVLLAGSFLAIRELLTRRRSPT
ncbi:hypothetical protein KSP35_22650 [Aquihabitans sp. G128]|uniref:hypothetical protein n=1 Tax=Aquihabitans sp. G128 TaxID=2849779 RepID=UPI001C233D80|nr:hypothetical protein [Aquihabitans sp. G128]QXC61077.1 hypothetical protein KSP35_22650 [Aquihabitans sp. G128]